MTTPVPSAAVGPFYRSLLEALESVAARDQVRSLLRSALMQARLETVPEEIEGFQRFVNGALTRTVERALGAGAADLVQDQLRQLTMHIAPSRAWQATGTTDETDEPSGERSVDLPPAFPRTSDVVSSQPRARADIAAALLAPELDGPLEAPTLFPSRAESGTQQKRALGRVMRDASLRGSRAGLEEVNAPAVGPRALATDVLVVTLDPRLVNEVQQRLAGRSRVVGVVSPSELTAALAFAPSGRIAVVLDTGVPAIDVATFATLAAALPTGAHVVLWGTDARQKARLTSMFPQTRAWVASGAAESPVDLLLDE